MTAILFPLWQIDRDEYEAVCSHLGLTPSPAIHERLNAYLGQAPSRFAAPQGFSRFLAGPGLTRFRVARLDLATRLLHLDHPVRHVLNAVIALHECDGGGYTHMSSSPTGAKLLLSVAVWAIGFGLELAITLIWLTIQFLRFMPTTLTRQPADLTGKRVLVIGASRGLGLDVMLECLERGADVVATVRTGASRNELAALLPAGSRARLLVSDLSNPSALVAALTQAGIDAQSLALAIFGAGVKHDGASVLSMTKLRETFEVNVFAAAGLAHWLCAAGASTEASSVVEPSPSASSESGADGAAPSPPTVLVLVSSMGRWHGMPFSAGYNASKAALSIWGESLAMELRRSASSPVSVMLVEPGLFESRMTRDVGVARLMVVSRRKIASEIIRGALTGKRMLRTPFWFALLTWLICLMGREARLRLLGQAKTSGRGVK